MACWSQIISLITNGLAFVILTAIVLWIFAIIGILILEIIYRIKEKLNA